MEQTDEFLKKLWDTPVTIAEWKRQIKIQKDKSNYEPIQVAFSTFFLNRTNRSGIIKAGVIGGLDQLGNYKIDARYNKDELSRRIKSIACHKDYIYIYQQDAIQFITKTLSKNKEKGLIFLDPPYYAKGKKLYTSFYEHEHHEAVAKAIKNSAHKHWIVTYDNAEEIDEIYDLKNKITYNLKYSLNHQSTGGEEFLFYSKHIKIPYHPNGVRIADN